MALPKIRRLVFPLISTLLGAALVGLSLSALPPLVASSARFLLFYLTVVVLFLGMVPYLLWKVVKHQTLPLRLYGYIGIVLAIFLISAAFPFPQLAKASQTLRTALADCSTLQNPPDLSPGETYRCQGIDFPPLGVLESIQAGIEVEVSVSGAETAPDTGLPLQERESPLDQQLKIEVQKGGQTIAEKTFPAAAGRGEFLLPLEEVKGWEEIERLSIQISNLLGGEATVKIQVRQLFLQVTYREPQTEEEIPIVKTESLLTLTKAGLRADEPLEITVAKEAPENLTEEIFSAKYDVAILDPKGQEVPLRSEKSGEDAQKASFRFAPPANLQPGKYTLKYKRRAGAVILQEEIEFNWGEPAEFLISDQDAQHTCTAAPFSQTVNRGRPASYSLKLEPSEQNAPFRLSTGELPADVQVFFRPAAGVAPAKATLEFAVGPSAQTGSFSLVVIYQEPQKDGFFLTNFCQLNLIIEP